jgi:hypothetical protein
VITKTTYCCESCGFCSEDKKEVIAHEAEHVTADKVTIESVGYNKNIAPEMPWLAGLPGRNLGMPDTITVNLPDGRVVEYVRSAVIKDPAREAEMVAMTEAMKSQMEAMQSRPEPVWPVGGTEKSLS